MRAGAPPGGRTVTRSPPRPPPHQRPPVPAKRRRAPPADRRPAPPWTGPRAPEAPRPVQEPPMMSSPEPAPGGRGAPAVHVPVLLGRVTELLAPACAADGAVLVDATLGLAGHSLALLRAHPGLRLVGLDRA